MLTDLIIADSRDAFLRDGYFDPEAVIGFFVQQIHAAVAAGYAGLRIFGDTIWAARGSFGSERLIEDEAKLNYRVDCEPATIMCPYQRRLFPASVLRQSPLH